MVTIEERIPTMTEAELEAFPLGIIRLDRNAQITFCNKVQAELGHRDVSAMVGRNFFREVAPCAAVKDFQGRFNEFVQTTGSRIESFAFLMKFAWGDRAVNITMVKRAGPPDRIFLVVNAGPVPA